MGDDYFSAFKLIDRCVKDVVDSISCDAVINRYMCTVTSANKTFKSTLTGPSLLRLFCSMQYYVAIQFVALANGLHMQRM
jgi:hypothetical protein